MQSKFQSNQSTLNLDPTIHEHIALLKERRCLILAEIEQLKCEPLQTTTIARRIDRLQQDYNRLVEEETVLTPGPLCDPLDVLPPELWASIMPDSPDDILILTMVSSRWCQALLSLPALWSTIILDSTEQDYWAKAITCLEISRPLEITLCVRLPLGLWTDIFPTVLAESGRIRSVDFYEADNWEPGRILDVLAKFEALPALRHLHFPRYSTVASHTAADRTIFRTSPRLEQIARVQFDAGTPIDPAFNKLRGVINIGSIDKEMAAVLAGMDNLSSLHISESWSMKDGAHSRNSGPLYLPSVTRFEYDGHSPIHALQFIGDNLVELILTFNIHDMLKLLMEVARFPVLQQLNAFIKVTDRLDPCDPTLAKPSSSLRHLQLIFQDNNVLDHMTKHEAIEYVAGREKMFTAIFSLLVITIPYARKVQLVAQFMVDPALKYTRSLHGLQSLAICPSSELSHHDDEIQRIACLPYIVPPEFLDGHHPLSRLDLYKPALRSHYQVILTDSLEESDLLPTLDTISSVPIPSVTTLSLAMQSSALFNFDVFPNLQSIELSGGPSVTWTSDFFEELVLRPSQWPFLEKISLSGLYLEWDILILMLERRNFVTKSNVKRIKTLELPTRLPYKLLYPITQLLKGNFVERPPLIELSIQAIGNQLQDSTLTGCHHCISTFRECNSKPYTYVVDSTEISGGLLLRGDRFLEWHYELPFEHIHPDPPLSPEAVQYLEGKRKRRLEYRISCKEAENGLGRDFRCSESMATQGKMTVGGCYMDSMSMNAIL